MNTTDKCTLMDCLLEILSNNGTHTEARDRIKSASLESTDIAILHPSEVINYTSTPGEEGALWYVRVTVDKITVAEIPLSRKDACALVKAGAEQPGQRKLPVVRL